MFERGMVHVGGGYIVYHYCLKLDTGVVQVVVVILCTFTVCCLLEQLFMFWLVILSTTIV
jgi:hypothetical protein